MTNYFGGSSLPHTHDYSWLWKGNVFSFALFIATTKSLSRTQNSFFGIWSCQKLVLGFSKLYQHHCITFSWPESVFNMLWVLVSNHFMVQKNYCQNIVERTCGCLLMISRLRVWNSKEHILKAWPLRSSLKTHKAFLIQKKIPSISN